MNREETTAREKGIILVVEDEHNLRQGIADFLRRRGFEVHTAENGERALEYLEGDSIDVVLTDMKMRGLSDIALLDAILEKIPDMQIIVMTAYGTVQHAVEAMKRGIYDYLTKPLNLEELLLYLERAIEKKRMQEELTDLRQKLHVQYSFWKHHRQEPKDAGCISQDQESGRDECNRIDPW